MAWQDDTRLRLVLCKGRCPLTPPKDEALGNPTFAQKIRLNGMKASLSSPSAVFFELVGVSRSRVLKPFSAALIPFERRKTFFTLAP
ncbi:hypothetical protein SAMN02745702_01691 [Desulfobaculum bizertense DSM 18034]|uniref:Uncharacterized protein n=1 Tax=Desulfobaculum bizertense DSM 18034 TaxID=1121442 RepID=A0A1T4W692_9BACT|nr:hypothetical protein SAMN02745702_01691 [Desulfobaculum bizertense DSM 18034]